MKFLKQSQLNFRNVGDQSVAVVADGSPTTFNLPPRVIMENTNSLLIPKGRGPNLVNGDPDPAGSQRPYVELNGMIRYNTSNDQFEFRQANQWRAVRFKEATQITQQSLGNGDDAELFFGPLNPAPPTVVESGTTWGAQNIVVLIENVFQISQTNYQVVPLDGTETGPEYSSAPYAPGWYIQFDTPVPWGKPVTVIHGFDR
jgi:hypothetical protein